jgi:hypothetical protein
MRSMSLTNAQILDRTTGSLLPGARFRRLGKGPEAELVERFLHHYRPRVPASCGVTVFREPWLASGAPDLVVVVWHTPTTAAWRDARRHVSSSDIKFMQLLVSNGPLATPDLRRYAGTEAPKMLRRLESAGLVIRTAATLRARNLRQNFAVRKIIAIEAKIAGWRRALEQAAHNRWFASESYVLLDRMPADDRAGAAAEAMDVGIWIEGEPMPRSRPRLAHRQPMSYTSWLFNEWCWRHAQGMGPGDILPADGGSGVASGAVS